MKDFTGQRKTDHCRQDKEHDLPVRVSLSFQKQNDHTEKGDKRISHERVMGSSLYGSKEQRGQILIKLRLIKKLNPAGCRCPLRLQEQPDHRNEHDAGQADADNGIPRRLQQLHDHLLSLTDTVSHKKPDNSVHDHVTAYYIEEIKVADCAQHHHKDKESRQSALEYLL